MSQRIVDAALLKLATEANLDGLKAINTELAATGLALIRIGEDGEIAFEKADKKSKSFAESVAKWGNAVTAAVNSFKGLLDKQYTQAKAEAQLELSIKKNTTALSRQGKSVRGLMGDWKEFANAQEAVTGIGDEATLSLLNLLSTLQVAPSQVKRVASALQDMEAVTGQSAESMARSMARLSANPEEALGALSRAGIALKKEMLEGMTSAQQFDFVLGKIEDAFEGQAKAIYDAAGGYGKFKTEADNLTETLGKVLYPSLSEIFGIVGALFQAFGKLSIGTQGLIVAIGGLAAVLWAFFASNPLGWITGAIFAIGGLITAANHLGSITDELNEINRKIDDANNSLAEISQQQVVQDDLLNRLAQLQQGTAAYEQTVRQLIKSNAELARSGINVKSSYGDIMEAIKKLDAASGTAKMNRLKDIADEALAAFAQARSQLTYTDLLGRRHPVSDEIANSVRATMVQALTTLARSLAMQGKLSFDSQDGGSNGIIRLSTDRSNFSLRDTTIRDLENPNFSRMKHTLLRYMRGSASENFGIRSSMLSYGIDDDMLQLVFENAKDAQASTRAPVDAGSAQSSAPAQRKILYDLEALRIRLLEEFAARRRQIEKEYNEEKATIEKAQNLTQKECVEALGLLEQDKNKKLEQLDMERIARERQARIDAINAAADAAASVISIGTSIIKKDWKSAIGSSLSMIPGVGQALSGVFGTAVEFFGSIFGSRSKTEAEKLGDWLEAAVQKFDASFVRSETYSKLFGDLDQTTIDAEIDSASTALRGSLAKLGLDPNASRKEFKSFYDKVFNADFRKINWDDYSVRVKGQKKLLSDNRWMKLDPNKEATLSIFRTNKNDPRFLTKKNISTLADTIRKLFRDMYGEYAPKMMELFDLTGSDSQIWSKWIHGAKDRLSQTNEKIHDIAKQSAEWFDRLESAQLKKGLSTTNEELGRINSKFELGEITKEKMIELSDIEINKALEYLRTLEPTQEVLDAITQLKLQQLKLQKELNDASAAGIGIEDEKLRSLLAQREALERDIAAGYIREGTATTVAQQESLLRQIIARAQELGLSRDIYFKYEEALSALMKGYLGKSYTGLTGFGFAPGLSTQDALAQFGVKPLDPAQVLPKIPITATQYYRDMLQAQSALAGAPLGPNKTITTNNQVVFNGQTIPSTQDQFDKLRAYVKQVYGIDIVKRG